MREDNINHPKHYNAHPSGIECIQITEHMNFNLGNAIKYLWRTEEKNGVEDLKKAIWYIHREINRIEREGSPKTMEDYKKFMGSAYTPEPKIELALGEKNDK